MHELALGPWMYGAAGGGLTGALILVAAVLPQLTTWLERMNRPDLPPRWPGQGPSGTGPLELEAKPSYTPAEEEQRRDRARAYWEAEQPPEDTLPAEGFIGDDGDPYPDAGPYPDGDRDPDARGQ
jgi:hypothetical protein